MVFAVAAKKRLKTSFLLQRTMALSSWSRVNTAEDGEKERIRKKKAV